jgi:hypothetical protein
MLSADKVVLSADYIVLLADHMVVPVSADSVLCFQLVTFVCYQLITFYQLLFS